MNWFVYAVPWSLTLISLIIAYKSMLHNFQKDDRESLKEDDLKFDGIKEGLLKANLKLDQVCTTTSETRTDIKSLNADLKAMDKRMTIVERDLKTAFNMIEELKGKTV